MGYMGFGMRKEDYKRKPRKALERYKEVYGNDQVQIDHDEHAPKLTKEEVLNKSRIRGLFEWKGFRIVKIIVLLVITAIILLGIINSFLNLF